MRKTQLASEPGQGVDALLWRVALGSIVAVFFAANPASSATYADCKAHAINMSGDARQKFMNTCLAGTGEKPPNCVNGKPCGNSCIARG